MIFLSLKGIFCIFFVEGVLLVFFGVLIIIVNLLIWNNWIVYRYVLVYKIVMWGNLDLCNS